MTDGSDVLQISLAIISTVGMIVVAWLARDARNTAKSTHEAVNSRMDAQIAQITKAMRAEGIVAGRAIERQETKEDASASGHA